MNLDRTAVDNVLSSVEKLGLLSETEHSEVLSVLGNEFPYAAAVQFSDSVHAHVKVADVDSMDHDSLRSLGYRPQNLESGYIKYATDTGLNLIFSSIPIAQDDKVPGAVTLPKPFMDHVGIDMRDEAADTRAVFDSIPGRAAELGWLKVTQGGPVHCCHTQVKAKHWTYPPSCWEGWRRPIEFAFGDLVIFDKKMGCDLRPMDPGHPMADAGAQTACSAATEQVAEPSPTVR